MRLKGNEDSYPTQLKRAKYDLNEDSNEEEEVETVRNESESKGSQIMPPLLTLSDDVLLILMAQLDPRDLISLGRTCQRLDAVTRDHTLWSVVDLRAHCMMLCQLLDFIEYFHPTTKFIASRGCLNLQSPSARWAQACTPGKILRDISKVCPNLETFIAVEHYFDARKVSVFDFPNSVKNFTLKSCEIYFLPKEKSYFHGIYKHMPNLEVLVLDDCQWLTPHSLMAISKCPNLRELSLKSCRNLGECVVYTSLAARFGFKSLEILDVRQTSLADNEICCFNRIDSLTHLFLECPRKRTPNDVDPVENGVNPNGHSRRGNQVADGVYCICQDDTALQIGSCGGECSKTAQIAHEVSLPYPSSSEVIVVSLVDGTTRRGDWSEEEVRHLAAFVHDDLPEYLETETLITDRGIMALGTRDLPGPEGDEDRNLVKLSLDTPMNCNPNLSHLIINNCKGVTDSILTHVARMSSLQYLNVCGTSISQSGIQQFLSRRPYVKVESDFHT